MHLSVTLEDPEICCSQQRQAHISVPVSANARYATDNLLISHIFKAFHICHDVPRLDKRVCSRDYSSIGFLFGTKDSVVTAISHAHPISVGQ